MPFYEYQCRACGTLTEVLQKVSDPPLKKCPECGKNQLQKLVSAPVFRSVMEDALRVMDVPPDDIDTWLAAQARGEAKRQAALPQLPEALDEGYADDPTIPPPMQVPGAGTGARR